MGRAEIALPVASRSFRRRTGENPSTRKEIAVTDTLEFDVQDGVGWIVLNRPEARNAVANGRTTPLRRTTGPGTDSVEK